MPNDRVSNKGFVVLNLKDNSEKDAIIKALSATEELKIKDTDGIITVYICETFPNKKIKTSYLLKKHFQSKNILFRSKGHYGLLERVAKLQNITLGDTNSLDAVCTGVIV